MSFFMYCIVASYAEMASVYPNCQGTIALTNRFVDPALGEYSDRSYFTP